MTKNGSASKIKIPSLEELFNSSEPIKTEDESEIVEIPLSSLVSFEGHPFKVDNPAHLRRLEESIYINGVINPIIISELDNGMYQIISGHCRKLACENLGLETIKAIIKDYSREEAIIAMVDANINRVHLLPSEKAKAYRMKFDAMKSPGYKVKAQGRAIERIGLEVHENPKKIQRFIKLSYLCDTFLDMLDKNELGTLTAYQLAFLNEYEQQMVLDEIKGKSKLVEWQAKALRKLSKNHELTPEKLKPILDPEFDKNGKDFMAGKAITPLIPQRVITFTPEIIADYFPVEFDEEKIKTVILELLDDWKKGGGTDVAEP